jgi:hypothetical protein
MKDNMNDNKIFFFVLEISSINTEALLPLLPRRIRHCRKNKI